MLRCKSSSNLRLRVCFRWSQTKRANSPDPEEFRTRGCPTLRAKVLLPDTPREQTCQKFVTGAKKTQNKYPKFSRFDGNESEKYRLQMNSIQLLRCCFDEKRIASPVSVFQLLSRTQTTQFSADHYSDSRTQRIFK